MIRIPFPNIRVLIIAGCSLSIIGMLIYGAVVVTLGARLGNVALDLYDKGFVSAHYAHKVHTAFVKFEGKHTDAEAPFVNDDDTAEITAMLNNLDVSGERARTDKEKSANAQVKSDLSALIDPKFAGDRPTLATVEKHLKKLTQRFADDAFELRNAADDTVNASKFILGGMTLLTLIAAGGLTAVLVLRIVLPLRQVVKLLEASTSGEVLAPPAGLAARKDEIGQIIALLVAQQQASRIAEKAKEEARLATELNEAQKQKALQDQLNDAKAQVEVVRDLSHGLDALALGDLTNRLHSPFPDQYESLRANFNGAIGALEETLLGLVAKAYAVGGAAEEFVGTVDSLSQRTARQAASLEEAASSLEELTTAVHQTAVSASQASGLAEQARSKAQGSGAVVKDAISAMSAIEDSSRQISNIIGVIDEIAFQTNLLALNAGVEAARAGDSGRGFAVVAQEVRALAQRSADAAREIKALISASRGQVESGVNLVARAGESLDLILGQVAEITDLVSGIASAAKQQSNQLATINGSIHSIDDFTRENVQIANNQSKISHALLDEAQDMTALTQKFSLGQSGDRGGLRHAS